MGVKKRRPNPSTSEGDVQVITLRIRPETKAKLLAHCQTRSLKEGRQLSYNQAIIDLIEGTPA